VWQLEDLNVQVLNGFKVRANRIVKEKSYYICSTNDGVRVIRKSADSRAHIVFQHSLKEQLYERGFSGTDRYYTTAEGAPYFELGENTYVMTGLFRHREADFGNITDLEKAMHKVAAFHSTARGLEFEQSFYGSENTLDSYRKQAVEFDAIKKQIGQRSRLSDFDVIFLKNYDSYRRLIRESLQILEHTNLTQLQSVAKSENAVCHNLLKEEHLLIDGIKVSLIGFSQAAIDYYVFDLCSVIQRYTKNRGKSNMNICEVLELYDKHRTLAKHDILILLGLLKYPSKFVKICRQYYSKKRTWTPSAIINRLEGIVEGKDTYDKFVEGLTAAV
jgi:spore coat protein I